MEFFAFADTTATAEDIRESVTLDAMPELCGEIESVDGQEPLGRVVYFLQWGRFHLRREEIMGGVRFWVPDCPNALAWTVTTGYPPLPGKIVLHATINRTMHDEDFIAATKALLHALKTGLEAWGGGNAAPQARPASPLLADLRGPK